MNSRAGKALAETQVIPLREAVLCVDCEMVSNSTQGHCLACGSHALMNIAAALGGRLRDASQPDAESMGQRQGARIFTIRRCEQILRD